MRVTSTKSKNSESFYINHAFKGKNGKSTSKVFKKLGTLKDLMEELQTDRDGVVAWAKEQARIETEKYNKETETVTIPFSQTQLIDSDKNRCFNVGYLFIQSILSSLRIDNICRNIKNRHAYEYNLEAILSDLIYGRVLSPSSKSSTFEFSKTLLESPKYEIHDVYRALSVIAEESDYIQAEVYKNSNFIHKRNKKILYYDCTNYYFEIEQADGDKQYGKQKEHRPNPCIGMGLFMDADGMPLAFDTYPGNQNEQKTLQPLEKKIIRDFECSEFIFCSDSGLGSQNNKLFNDMGNRSYVITQSLKKLKKEDREIALNPKQYRKIGTDEFVDLSALDETNKEVFNSVYYKEIPLESKKISETLIVTYSPKYRAYQANIRQGQIDRAMRIVNENGKVKKTHKNPNDPARFIKKTAITENGEIADKEFNILDQEAIDKEAIYDGFYGVTTNLDGDVEEIIEINKRRWQIEECFRIMKTDFEARPVYLQRDDRIKAHFLICFLALLSYRLLDAKLEHKYTVENTLDTLRTMNVTLIDGYGYIPSYTRTKITDNLHDIFGFRTDTQIVKKSKMRSIIKQTKGK
ncbi:DDE family transposase [Breznakia blatticola]|uniref:DDE family transposase n=1 Tax=Breznakia blatticola TaxID=1754012 RepID=A0A4R7Z7B0_9FIRM|nr:IS1634 family transposase [Breznakia blatticola]TDW07528.1 DDE family transposase [Breznakia blatticola]